MKIQVKVSDATPTVRVAPSGDVVYVGGNEKFTTDETLTLKNGVLSVNRATKVEADNTLPITSAAVHTTVGNIEAILKTI